MSRRRDFYRWRVVATGISFTLFGLGGLVLGFVILPAIVWLSSSRDLGTRRSRRLVQLSFRSFVCCMRTLGVLTWEVEGEAELRREGQLIIANHPTLIDIVFLISMIPNATCIVKSELYRNVFTRGPVRMAGYVPNDSPDQLLDDCNRELRSRASLIIFPEGSRTEGPVPGRFKRGAAYLWLRARCSVSLVTIVSSPPTLAKHEKWYQVPAVRPHFRLTVNRDQTSIERLTASETSVDARLLTRQWQNHFTKEIAA